ncbi:MAG TPA: hypothetical protein VK892_03555 [Pyrinomonadaceae bacterium]|nr:hypothetical protein [Pyrinomonadaceae bacterium]
MGKVNKQLPSGETVIYEAKLHWKIFILPTLILLFGGYLYLNEWFILSYPFLGIGFIWLVIFGLIPYLANKFFVTTKHASQKHVFPSYFSNDIPLNQISGILVEIPVLGRILNYGNVVFQSASGKQVFKDVYSPKEFRQAIEEANSSQTKSDENTSKEITSENSILPTKAISVLPSELERVQSEFKFYSPAQKSIRTAPLPKVGEEWILQRTLPSGLLLIRDKTDESFWKLIKDFIPEVVLGRDIYADFDERPYLYHIEKFKDEDARRGIQLRETISVAWHPVGNLLATAGDGNMPRIWDVSTGEAIAKRVIWHTMSPRFICWSPDGKLFISGESILDGVTGKYLCGTNAEWNKYSANSSITFEHLRGLYAHSGGMFHLLSNNNFNHWRPNTKQFVNRASERNLIVRNGCSGKVEKIIDCGEESSIEDFAWHPKGRFIAVSFREHNIRIIDVDEAKIVDDLSVQNLVGWSLDGKILVAREDKNKDDFVVWDALETKEKPMPEEIENELWFKRFSTNISADGLRYIKVRQYREGNIYSLESDELLFTLPKETQSAAWHPTDGGLLATCGGSETHIWRV